MTNVAPDRTTRRDAAGGSARPTVARSRAALIAVLAIMLVAAALRFMGLQSQLWYDEIVTLVRSARRPVYQLLTEFPGVNDHPLYSLLAHASLTVFGESAWALRLPACLFGIASVAMVYILGSRVTTRTEAWAGAVVLATSYHHIWFSQDARGYTLLGFLTLLTTYSLVRAAESARSRDYVVYAVACAAGLYTHLMMAFVMLGHAGVLLVGRARPWRSPSTPMPLGPFLWACAASGAVAAIVYAPFAPGLAAYLLAPAPREAVRVATTRWAIGEAVQSIFAGAGVPAAIAAGMFAVTGAVSLWRRERLAAALLIGPAVVTGLALLALRHMVRPRFFFFLSGAAAIFVGRGLGAAAAALWRRRVPHAQARAERAQWGIIAGALALVALSAAALPRNYAVPKQDFNGALQFAEAAERRGARIAAAGPACLPLSTYFGKSWPCLKSVDEWERLRSGTGPAFVVLTLEEYIEDLRLLEAIRANCPTRARFPGTLGGGDLTVCEVR